MRFLPCSALLVPLLLASGLAAAQERTGGRLSRDRTLEVPSREEGPPPELHVAGGTATVLSVDGALGSEGPRLQDERGRIRLVPLEGASFIVLPSTDVPEGERVLLTVPLQSGGALRLALVSREDEVDTQVRLVPRPERASREAVEGLARLLSGSAEGAVALPLLGKRWLVSGKTRLRLESVIRLERHVFITLAGWNRPRALPLEQQLRPHAVMKDGTVVALSLCQVAALPSESPLQQRTLVALLPEGAEHLTLEVSGAPASDERMSFPLHRAKPAP